MDILVIAKLHQGFATFLGSNCNFGIKTGWGVLLFSGYLLFSDCLNQNVIENKLEDCSNIGGQFFDMYAASLSCYFKTQK